jgi:hypothetical protein
MSRSEAVKQFPDKFILVRREPDIEQDDGRPPVWMYTVLYVGDDYRELCAVDRGLEDSHRCCVIEGEYYANVPGIFRPAPGCYWKLDKKKVQVDDVSSAT